MSVSNKTLTGNNMWSLNKNEQRERVFSLRCASFILDEWTMIRPPSQGEEPLTNNDWASRLTQISHLTWREKHLRERKKERKNGQCFPAFLAGFILWAEMTVRCYQPKSLNFNCVLWSHTKNVCLGCCLESYGSLIFFQARFTISLSLLLVDKECSCHQKG